MGNHESLGIATGKILKKEDRAGDLCGVKMGDDVLVTDMEGYGIILSPNKPNIRKWNKAARNRSSSSVLLGFPSPIQVFKDPWIPRPSSIKLVSSSCDDELKMVAFIDKISHWWDVLKLEEVLLDIDRDEILSILLSIQEKPDRIMWHFDKSGIYKVKSGYKLGMNERTGDGCSNFSADFKWWQSLWNLNIPPKVEVFV
ncbi:hypothetical protein JRO89_XS01G0135800 [Xanthoceras sorbifolium]|uniref:Uncharacterized protein n=1 Tax=Xanthoceras sorbifolium TaxID=99658 RepID=A0ABQ8IJ64_9ROSI|nr:hypothetical protein JRO89_XS01G0135800 [Xanthoceras sorbifolium]